jgi:pimeloyl-ACP methyl ester carboxylesterase
VTVVPPAEVQEVFVHRRPGDDELSPQIVFIHGSMDRSSSFVKTMRTLRDCSCTRYDRRGYGRSIAVQPDGGLDQQVDDLSRIVGRQAVVLVGHSLGGVIALTFADRFPGQVCAVVVYEAPMPWADWWPADSAGGAAMKRLGAGDAHDVAEKFMRRMIGDDRWEELPDSVREKRRREGTALVADMGMIYADGPPYRADRLTMPVVAGRGTESVTHHRRTSAQLAEEVPAAMLIEIEGAGHGAHFSHPEEFAALIRRALDAAAGADT